MLRLWSIVFLVACLGSVVSAEPNKEMSGMAKVYEGLSTAMLWLYGMVTGGEKLPPRKVKIAQVGLGRCGTTSFHAALQVLGYTPLHDEAFVFSDEIGAFMEGKLSAAELNVRFGLGGYDAPLISTHKYVQWAATAPDVKVILLTRDTKKWARSFVKIMDFPFIFKQRPYTFFKNMRDVVPLLDEIMINVTTQGRPELAYDVPTLEAGFDAWAEFVKEVIPAERLLVFDVRQGWAPLCEFLEIPTPSVPFPHVNEATTIAITLEVFRLLTWIWPLVFASPLLLLWCFCRCCCRKQLGDSSKKHQ